MIALLLLVACVDGDAKDEPECVAEPMPDCPTEFGRWYMCDSCGQNFGCSSIDPTWKYNDVDCDCNTEAGRRDTASSECRITE